MHNSKVYQHDSRAGWMYMSVYWLLGLVVGLVFYLPTTTTTTAFHRPSSDHLLATAVTVFLQPRLLSRFDSFGRKVDVPAAILFAVTNGLCETMMFLASYDLGRHLTGSHTMGFVSFSVYAALIHAQFWLPYGFPQHIKPEAAPFLCHGLPELLILSLAWMHFYTSTGDIVYLCLLHMLSNCFVATKIRLQSPTVWQD
jgi:hypothetical protein